VIQLFNIQRSGTALTHWCCYCCCCHSNSSIRCLWDDMMAQELMDTCGL